MKLNNKGMTLVELLITFSLLLIIVVGMFNLILEVKFELDEKQIAKDFTEYSATLNHDIHYNLLRNKPFAILIKQSSEVGEDKWICYKNSTGTCTENTSTKKFAFSHDGLTSTKTYTDLNNLCKNIYPCSVYVYKNGTTLSYNSIALNIGGTNTSSGDELLNKHGIYYNGVYESIPNQEYVSFTNSQMFEEAVKIEMKEDEIFIIDFSFYLVENDKNYGFKIAYPFSQE